MSRRRRWRHDRHVRRELVREAGNARPPGPVRARYLEALLESARRCGARIPRRFRARGLVDEPAR